MKTTVPTTLLDLVQSINAYAANDREVVATVAYLVNSGRVRLGGTFAGATIQLSPARHPRTRRLAPDGTETTRIASPLSDSIPLDSPAPIAFDNKSKSLLVTNHASLSGNAAHFAALKVFVGDTADPLATPTLP